MNRKTFIVTMCALHFFTAILLCGSAAPMGVTAVYSLAVVLGDNRFVLAAFYTVCAGLALYRELCRQPKTPMAILWFLPSLFIIVCAAIGALVCIINGSYADATPRPIAFIARDQIIYPILAWLYFKSIVKP